MTEESKPPPGEPTEDEIKLMAAEIRKERSEHQKRKEQGEEEIPWVVPGFK